MKLHNLKQLQKLQLLLNLKQLLKLLLLKYLKQLALAPPLATITTQFAAVITTKILRNYTISSSYANNT